MANLKEEWANIKQHLEVGFPLSTVNCMTVQMNNEEMVQVKLGYEKGVFAIETGDWKIPIARWQVCSKKMKSSKA